MPSHLVMRIYLQRVRCIWRQTVTGNVTASGTVSAEQLTSTDDLTVDDEASIDGTMTIATGSITDSVELYHLITKIYLQLVHLVQGSLHL